MNQDSTRLRELAALFLKLGTIAFGGPAAHVAMMEDEVVRRRSWLSRDEFLDLLGATNLIPGPNSTEMAIHIGYRRAGFAGLLVAGCCFIVPAVIIVTIIAWLYVKYGQLPVSNAVLTGVKPVIIAIVAQALWRLGQGVMKNALLATVGLVALVANLLGVNELVVLFSAAAFVMVITAIRRRASSKSITLPVVALPLPIFLIFLKIGSVLFGSGYVLLAFLRADLVTRFGWLTEAQLLDAVAVGQVTPGPLFTTATFIGYVLAGPKGALAATVGIFLPAFVFVALSAPLIPRLRRSPTAAAMLDGLNVGSLALMATVTFQLTQATLTNLLAATLAIVSAVLLIRFRLNSTWLVTGGALVGLTLGWLKLSA